MPVHPDVRRFLFRRLFGSFAGIEADDHHVEILARLQRKHAERANQIVELLRAEHRALVIYQGQDHGTLAIEILAQRHVLAVIVFEYGVERQRLTEPLLNRRSRSKAAWAGLRRAC